ncbi:hypothetical protein LTR85_011674 [Meristemomyces frigidus]|nr:hypothetical protein LTR85_011674 [Meristemomyces frigidus]
MNVVRSSRALSSSDRACLQCQRRKTKCIPTESGEICTYCVKAGKTCVFSDKQIRTPLTRKNLDDAEARCRRLEAALQQVGSSAPVEDELPEDDETIRPMTATSTAPVLAPGLVNDAGPGQASTPYEWNESPSAAQGGQDVHADKAPDGMASLGDGGETSGYLGNSSGYSLLQSVSSLLPARPGAHGGVSKDSNEARMGLHVHMPSHDGAWSYQLTATMVQSQLIDAYFRCYNSSYPILHERNFRDKCAIKSKLPRDSSWNMVYYMVLAIGEWISGHCNDDVSLYYDAAHSRFGVRHLESGNAHSVQAFLLMGNYLQKTDRPNTGYNFIGIAYRMALGLGLHREPSTATDQQSPAIHRRRVLFWCLYCFDSGFSMTTGRPILVSESFIDVRGPSNIDDSQCDTSTVLPTEVAYPTTYSALIAQSRPARIANKIHTQFMSALPCTDVDQQTSIMEQMIHNRRTSLPSYFWSADVPDWFIGPRQIVFWKQANLRMLLLLASQKQHTDSHDKLATGRRYRITACETIEDIVDFCQRQAHLHHGLSWYAIYFLLQACLALSVHQVLHGSVSHVTLSEQDEGFRTYEAMSSRAQQCLGSLAPANKAAARSLRVLSRLRENVRQSSTSPQSGNGLRQATTPVRINRHGVPAESISSGPGSVDMPLMPRFETRSGFADPSGSHNLMTPGLDNMMLSDWGIAADPSLHVFFNGTDDINDLFQGVDGFPGTQEHDAFAYQGNGMSFE